MSAVQTLGLDARRRAMLDEMGVKVWWPMPEAPAATAPEDPEAVHAARQQAAPSAEAPERRLPDTPAPIPARPVVPPAQPVDAVEAAAAAPAPRAPAMVPVAQGAAVLVEAPRRLYAEAASGASPQGGWLVVADMPPEADGRHGEPFAGDAGRLLDNMLRALKLHEGRLPVHLMRTHRGVASGQPGGSRAMAEAFGEQAAALAPCLVLAMGPLAAQGLMQSGEPLGKLRGRVVQAAQLDGVPVVATYHPAYLLRNPVDKGRAWADLCLAAEQQPQLAPPAAG